MDLGRHCGEVRGILCDPGRDQGSLGAILTFPAKPGRGIWVSRLEPRRSVGVVGEAGVAVVNQLGASSVPQYRAGTTIWECQVWKYTVSL